ncbi:MAG TPA: glycosyltransferase family 39 protein [Asticcacaulis sp.]|nr:glycosyltransferase family 39 protein [Asticcacaulis sp.]
MTSLLHRLKTIPYLPVIVALTALRLVAAARAGLVPDEAYYWLWAQHPALGYYDHPPMVAWWIGTSTAMFGHSALAVRLPFLLSFLVLCGLIYDTARVLFGHAVAKRALLWANACILLSVGSVVATPDPPSVLMWAGGLWALARLITSGKGWWWLTFGLFAGLGVEAKYTNLFLGLGVIVWFLLEKRSWRWLATPWPYLGAVVALAAMAPNLLWNAGHGYITLAKQFGRLEASIFTIKYLIEFLISQPLLLNPLIFVFVFLSTWAWAKTRTDSRLTLLVALPLPLLIYMLIHVFHDRIQGNWPAPVFPGLVILAAAGAEASAGKWLIRLRNWAAPLGVTISALALGYLALGDAVKGPGAAGLSQGWDGTAAQIDTRRTQAGAAWIATTDYDTEGELSYHLKVSPVIAVTERERYAWPTAEPSVAGRPALIVVAERHDPVLEACFDNLADLGSVSRAGKPAFRVYSGQLKAIGCDVP